jgi:hypothetical protein
MPIIDNYRKKVLELHDFRCAVSVRSLSTILENGTNMKGGHSVIVEADSIEHKLVQGHHFLVEKYQNASILTYFFLPPPQRVV